MAPTLYANPVARLGPPPTPCKQDIDPDLRRFHIIFAVLYRAVPIGYTRHIGKRLAGPS